MKFKEWEGFNEDRTYYVIYDEQNNMRIGDKIKIDGSNVPEEWYDYGSRKWANIVVTDGKVQNGKQQICNTIIRKICKSRNEPVMVK